MPREYARIPVPIPSTFPEPTPYRWLEAMMRSPNPATCSNTMKPNIP